MPRICGEHACINAHQGERPLVFIVQPAVENQLLRSRAVQPAIIGDLVFQLAWPQPA